MFANQGLAFDIVKIYSRLTYLGFYIISMADFFLTCIVVLIINFVYLLCKVRKTSKDISSLTGLGPPASVLSFLSFIISKFN